MMDANRRKFAFAVGGRNLMNAVFYDLQNL